MADSTLRGALERLLREAMQPSDGMIAPAAVLWTDPEGIFRPIIRRLRESVLPEVYALGEHDPGEKTGPAIWLRCIVDRTVPESPAPERTPVFYLPGVARQELRSGPDCPAALRPLVELQFRGTVWHQRNGRDWTLEAFFTSPDALGLDCAKDAATRLAMQRALPLLADENLDALRGTRLDAGDFDRLAVSDPVRDMLRWLSGPEEFRRIQRAEERWEAFRNLARAEFGFDVEEEDPREAAVRIVEGARRWESVWRRFEESPRLYPGFARALAERGPDRTLLVDASRDPRVNRAAEDALRIDLERAAGLPHAEACQLVGSLEASHEKRRRSAWRELDLAPWAVVLEPLARLAMLARSPLAAPTLDAAADAYARDGWRCDRAALDALTIGARTPDPQLVATLVRRLYEPWADASARSFQELVEEATRRAIPQVIKDAPMESGVCYLFVDGLRFDLGVRLHERLEERGLTVRRTHRIAPLPTVTPTAKPVAAPLPLPLRGSDEGDDFTPLVAASGQPAITTRFWQELARLGIACQEGDAITTPPSESALGWAEAGDIDKDGHHRQGRVVEQLDLEIERIADRVARALDSGWKRVKVVTDHGWLLLPGGLPKVELPAHLTETKWARCAVVRTHASPEIPTWRWHWNSSVRIASPPGIACFSAGNEYAHGGVSPQECVVPELLVTSAQIASTARIVDVRWMGLRCRVTTSDGSGYRIDIRLKPRDASSTIAASAKEIPAKNEVSLVVDDQHEGSSASVVLITTEGELLDQRLTTVGDPS